MMSTNSVWVVVNPKSYEVVDRGTWEYVLSIKEGHKMTESRYKQILEERENEK